MADRRVRVILEAQIAQFQQGMRRAQAELGQVAQTAGKGEKQLGGIGAAITGRVLPAVGGLIAGWQTYDKVVKAGFERFADLEDAEKRMRQMGLSTGEVEGLMAGLKDTVTGTAFSLNDGAGVMAKFVASGMDIGEVNDRLEMTADTAAFAQAPLSEIGDIFTRIQSEGRLTGDTLNQLQVRGVPALNLLADTAGVSEIAMRDMISNGLVDADRFFGLWETGSKGFGEDSIRIEGAAKNMGDTLRGSLENAGTAAARLGVIFVDDVAPFIRDLSDGFRSLVDQIELADESTTGWNSSLSDLISKAREENVPWWEKSIPNLLGLTGDAAEATGVLGGEVDRVRGVIEQYIPEVSELAEETDAVAEATAAATEAFTAHQDAVKAATDPVFALQDALGKVAEAEAALEEVRSDSEATTADVTAAEWALFEALTNADAAAHNGALSFEGVNAVLDDMVAKGLISAETAESLRGQIDEARLAAEDYTGPYVADLLAEIDDPAIRAAKAQLDAVARTRSPRYLAELDRQAEIRARNKLNAVANTRTARVNAQAAGTGAVQAALNRLTQPRYATVYVNVKTYGNLEFHKGGLVPSGGVPRLHDGGLAGLPRFHNGVGLPGLAGDEIPAILQTGERVLSRSQTAVFDRLQRMMGNTSMGGPSSHGSTTPAVPASAAPGVSTQQLRRALDGMTLFLEDRRGQTVARVADLYGRGG